MRTQMTQTACHTVSHVRPHQVSQCTKLVGLAALAAADPLKRDPKLARLVAKVAGGKGRGRSKQPLFSAGVDGQVSRHPMHVVLLHNCIAGALGASAA